MGKNDVQKMVVDLRKALDPKPKTFGDIPDFNLKLAHHLYRQLLEPVNVDWDTFEDLIIISSGPFGQLPFSVLPTKQVALDQIQNMAWAFNSLPWAAQEIEDTQKVMGKNFWPYGIDANRKTLEALFQYSYEQGLAKKPLTVEELFHPASLHFTDAS